MTEKAAQSRKKRKRRSNYIEIDYELVDRLGSIMCTQPEIAAVLGLSLSKLEHDDEFKRRHRAAMDKSRASLRRMQYKTAEGGNPTMQIWLGKQYLGQSDKQETELSGPDGRPISIANSSSERLKKYATLFQSTE